VHAIRVVENARADGGVNDPAAPGRQAALRAVEGVTEPHATFENFTPVPDRPSEAMRRQQR
jgi:hypothetical protein